MPVRYSIDPETQVIHTRMIGEMTSADLQSHFEELQGDPKCTGTLYVLLDAIELTSIPTVGMIQFTKDMVELMRGRVKFAAVAVAAVNSAQFGMFRLGQVILEPIFGPTNVFRDLDSARDWLERQRASRR
ncbi:MAG: hypothetical protein HZA61_10925 [Candidatus Eisenbacteria bacterium]|uniref:STAS/SEC14 domain-containing protein n=1 Tax=Eiseniibacteriota bacterium TaxID=2212470 RepID=A0A933W8Y0_UNCEI|nr:hypothetical protein [Candidatus Eisenbacteria bacterium]